VSRLVEGFLSSIALALLAAIGVAQHPLVGAQHALAVTQHASGGAPRPDSDPVPITRADLTLAYMRLERALKANPPAQDRIAEVDAAFDKATSAFIAGSMRQAIERVDDLTAAVDAAHPLHGDERLALAMRAELDPPVLVAGKAPHAELEVALLYPVSERAAAGAEHAGAGAAADAASDAPLRFVLLDPQGAECASAACPRLSRNTRTARAELAFSREEISVGRYRIALAIEGRAPRDVGRCFVVARSIESVRHANEERLAKIESAHPKLARALDTCRARNQLLAERPSKSASAQFLTDPNALQAELANEIRALEQGKDPYYRRPGDLWRVFRQGTLLVPLHTYAPKSVEKGTPLPLVVALHGSSGDENSFFEGYGAGELRDLAEERGFIVAAPEQGAGFGDGKRFDALLESLSRDFVIDANRVYVIGHSMGASAAAQLATSRKTRVAAVACFAGKGDAASADIAPTLVVVGENDPLCNALTTGIDVETERMKGVPIELRTAPGQGHTLSVARMLPEAIEWLLAHERGKREEPSSKR
jgi:pimeloyl-ACP methyl ester carboxylesterase